jgi:hypothetical protein
MSARPNALRPARVRPATSRRRWGHWRGAAPPRALMLPKVRAERPGSAFLLTERQKRGRPIREQNDGVDKYKKWLDYALWPQYCLARIWTTITVDLVGFSLKLQCFTPHRPGGSECAWAARRPPSSDHPQPTSGHRRCRPAGTRLTPGTLVRTKRALSPERLRLLNRLTRRQRQTISARCRFVV